ncbi:uncharacterized protein LOC144006816 [Festucalex cinctus]
MSPSEIKTLLLSVFGIVLLFYFIPFLLYVAITVAICNGTFYASRQTLPAVRSGLKRRANTLTGYLRRFWDWRRSNLLAVLQRRTKLDVGIQTPDDLLTGSSTGRPESTTGDSGRAKVVQKPRDQPQQPSPAVSLQDWLSITGQPLAKTGDLTFTPQRQNPLQQSVGDAVRKKNTLLLRNSSDAHRHVEITWPDRNRPSTAHPSCSAVPRAPCSSQSLLRESHKRGGNGTDKSATAEQRSKRSTAHPSCSAVPRAPEDPCSSQSVLRESHNRGADDMDTSATAEQRSKRRRNDGEGSSHLDPQPGRKKLRKTRGVEEPHNSSISLTSGAHAPRGGLGSERNAIQNSYSSTQHLRQVVAERQTCFCVLFRTAAGEFFFFQN